jgi:hypothetical protein
MLRKHGLAHLSVMLTGAKAFDVTDSTTNADFRNIIIAHPVLIYCVLMSLVSLALFSLDVRAR